MRVRGCRFLLLLLMLCASGSGVQPAGAAEYAASDYLPLAVGNSWTYGHEYYDIDRRFGEYDQWPAYFGQESSEFTITVERTEELDGKTYFVISDMPALWPSPPPHFIAGKKLRWEGTHLMEYRAGKEQALYRFDGADETGYTVFTDEGDNLVKVRFYTEPVPLHTFRFSGGPLEGSRALGFLAGYGMVGCGWRIHGEDHPVFINQISSIRAVISGNQIEEADAWIPTSTSSSTWGEVKQSLFAQGAEAETDR